jgi:hypothetical protein
VARLGGEQLVDDGVAGGDECCRIVPGQRVGDAGDEGGGQLGGEVHLSEVAPPAFGWRVEVFQHVREPARAAGQVLGGERAEHCPAQPGAL